MSQKEENDFLAQSEHLQKSLDEGLKKKMSSQEKQQFFSVFNKKVDDFIADLETNDKEAEEEIKKHKAQMKKIMESVKKDRDKYNNL